MATKTARRVAAECTEKIKDPFTQELRHADLLAGIGVVNWAIMQANCGGANPCRKGVFAAAWARAAGGTPTEAARAATLADARHTRVVARRVAEAARRGGNCYVIYRRDGRRVARRLDYNLQHYLTVLKISHVRYDHGRRRRVK
jgi:hypothetical protein